MKKKLSILLSLILVCLCAVGLTVAALAEGEEEQTITVSYMNTQDTTSDTTDLDKTAYENGKQTVGVGEKFTLPTTSSNSYAGKEGFQLVWYTVDGRTYKAGEEVSFTKDTKLFRCVAKECYTMTDVNYAMKNESKAAILMADINTGDGIGVENQGQSVLILNGYTVNITKNGNLIVKDLGNKVCNPNSEVDGRNKTEETCNESGGVLFLGVAYYSVDAAYNPTEECDEKNLCNLGELLKGSCERIFRCHIISPLM